MADITRVYPGTVLLRAYEILRDRQWVQGRYAEDKAGRSVNHMNPNLFFVSANAALDLAFGEVYRSKAGRNHHMMMFVMGEMQKAIHAELNYIAWATPGIWGGKDAKVRWSLETYNDHPTSTRTRMLCFLHEVARRQRSWEKFNHIEYELQFSHYQQEVA